MIRHNLRRVRMNPDDQTWHCAEHGLLRDAEALDISFRVGAFAIAVIERNARLGRLARVFDWFVTLLPARCEVIE